MLIKIHPDDPNQRKIDIVVDTLRNGGVIIYPTDTIYGLGCDINNSRAVERIARIKGVNLKKTNFSFICYDLSHISDFTRVLENNVFKLMKKNLPGAFTFILPANNKVPKFFKSKKKSVGIRVPDNNVAREIVRVLGHPIVTTSLHSEDKIVEYPTDPELIYEDYKNLVDVVIDSGFGDMTPSTIIDCTNNTIEITRQGKGDLAE